LDREYTELLVIIPSGYPSIPPDNFFVPTGFKIASGKPIGNYSEPVAHINRQWGQFSYHLDGEWKPASNILDGDNLMSFMLKVNDRLEEAS